LQARFPHQDQQDKARAAVMLDAAARLVHGQPEKHHESDCSDLPKTGYQ
jgi:hypothetical protein